MNTRYAAALAKWNAMSNRQKNVVATTLAVFTMILLTVAANSLEYLFGLHSFWFRILTGPIAMVVCLYPLLRWKEKQRLRAD